MLIGRTDAEAETPILWPLDAPQTDVQFLSVSFVQASSWFLNSCCCSVTQSCLTLCNHMNCSMQFMSITDSWSSPKLMCIESVMPSSHLILCRLLLLLSPIPPSIRVFSNESTLCMRWPKYWSFSFSIIPSKEIPGLISFRIDWLDLLASVVSNSV